MEREKAKEMERESENAKEMERVGMEGLGDGWRFVGILRGGAISRWGIRENE